MLMKKGKITIIQDDNEQPHLATQKSKQIAKAEKKLKKKQASQHLVRTVRQDN